MAAVKEREVIVVATRPQDRSDSRWGGGGDSVPPGGSSDGGDGPGGGPSTLLVLLTILFCLAGATAVIAAFSNSIIEAANIYITNISDEMDAGVLSSSIVVMFWLIIPISIVCLLFLNNHALNFCRIEIRAQSQAQSCSELHNWLPYSISIVSRRHYHTYAYVHQDNSISVSNHYYRSSR